MGEGRLAPVQENVGRSRVRDSEGHEHEILDRLVNKTYKLLEAALDTACPIIQMQSKIGTSHWATEKHNKGKAKVNDLYKTAKKTKSQSDWESY